MSETPESMYDKLGDLLSEQLDSGVLFSAAQAENVSPRAEEPSGGSARAEHSRRPQKIRIDLSAFGAEKRTRTGEILRFPQIPESVMRAFDFLKIPGGATYEEAKRAYRESLMHFHPDKWSGNFVLQKMAKEKTEMILSSWRVIEDWFKKQGNG